MTREPHYNAWKHSFDLIEQVEIGVDKNFELSTNRCEKQHTVDTPYKNTS